MRIGFIGFGEAARAFVASLAPQGDLSFFAYDTLLQSGSAGEAPLREAASSLAVALTQSPAALSASADWIICAVTAADSLDAARSVAGSLTSRHVFVDINSVSAGRKRDTARIIVANGAAYLDMAVMAPIHPKGHRTPVLVAGPDSDRLLATLETLGFNFSIAGHEIGAATSIKMLRSLFVKGMEALTVQTLLAARAAGRFDEVYASLSGSFPQLGWPAYPKYQLERMARHGIRRAAEMDESAATLGELGFDAGHDLAAAIADFQRRIGTLGFDADTDGAVDEQFGGLLAAYGEHNRQKTGEDHRQGENNDD